MERIQAIHRSKTKQARRKVDKQEKSKQKLSKRN